ncbi:MAG: SRPBCC domain-containing protein [Chloroflexi bacterium]|nr:MAG: SRPBCC domain-containing protein [Chloroflexota bacterium]TME47513.1 MAG: SRPBCC domain-containing protein [Chloroflexota bacterium]
MTNRVGTAPKEVTMTRTLAAPRETVFNAWTDPKQVARWWGPADWTNPVCEIDARPGGRIHIVMRGPDPWGDNPMDGQFQEVVTPERLVFRTSAIPDGNGHPQLETLNTVTFEERDGQTTVHVTIVVLRSTPEAAPALAGMEEGWKQQLDKLAADLRR